MNKHGQKMMKARTYQFRFREINKDLTEWSSFLSTDIFVQYINIIFYILLSVFL